MKNLKYIVSCLVVAFFMYSCDQGIDGITQVDPGNDESAPQIKINYPSEGLAIKVFEETTDLDIDIEVTDDIEIASISVQLNGSEIAKFNSFKDYRRALEEFTYNGLVDGDHILTVNATDIEGKASTASVNFSKQPPYSALFEGEVLYMPFDGDYRDLIGFNVANKVGAPGFAGAGFAGTNAYKGATDSYLTFPSDGLKSNEFSAAFWYKVNPSPDRSGILVIGDDATDRNQGFRLFREGNGTEQRIKLNVGTGSTESWNDGGIIDVTAGEWVHVAFTISQTETKIYFDGIEMNTGTLAAPIDWTGVGSLTIGAGGETFSYWNHLSDNSDLDELRIFNKALTQADIQIMLNSYNPYTPLYGESFYMPFNDNYINLVGGTAATPIGTPSFNSDSYEGSGAYLGATDSYLTHPAGNLLTNEFSATFWYKVDATADRAGILVVGNDIPENRNQGFRLFREGNATEQRIKLNVGVGTGESWNDGGVIDVTAGEWVHVAMTISNTQSKIYFNGVEVNSAALAAPIDWTGCANFTIGAGGSTFSYWNHLSDNNSSVDELRFYPKELSSDEVIAILGGDYVAPNFGSTLYMPFDGNFEEKNSNTEATAVGSPDFAGESVVGSDAYLGATDSYVSFPITDLFSNEFSGAFWYKVDGTPDRAGIITVAPPMLGTDNDLTSGFRLLREGSATEQRIKLHIGTDGGDVWNDGEVIDVTAGEWVHIAFTVSETETKIYFNGVAVTNMGDMTGKTISWNGCANVSIGSGAPGFIGWNHLSDLSEIDELYLFDRVITTDEIQALIENN